ncbi:MAG: glycosyltransferase family 2 protein [Spirosomataceae bacterium]
MEKIAIVVLNYNGRNFLEKFLPSVVQHSPPHAIYMADSASKDDSVAWVKAHYPQIHTIELGRNFGYAGGYNRALAQIEAQYYVLLNSDVEVTPNWLSPLIQLLDNTPQIAACQPKLLAYHDKTQFEYAGAAGGYIDWLGVPYCRGRIFDHCETDRGQYDSTIPIFWASGACLFIRAAAFHEAGGFDEDFFAHMEEIDLCWRLHLLGHSVYCCPESVVYHVGGGTLPPSNPFKTYLNYRNSLAMLYKNLPSQNRWGVIFLRLVVDGLSAVRFLPKGQWQNIVAIIKAHFKFYTWAFSLLPAKRKKIKQMIGTVPTINSSLMWSQSIVWNYFVRAHKTFNALMKVR